MNIVGFLFDLNVWIRIAGSCKLLTVFVYPEVRDPLCAGEDGAGRVSGAVVPLAVGVEVVPERHGSLLGLEGDAEVGEDCCSALLDLGLVHEQSGDPVPGPQTGKRVFLFSPKP